MGLLNLGKKEGSQIIQMFGRGVRLKGRDFSLKRSLANERHDIFSLHLDKLETLNVFGIKADYMDKFKAYLQDEGVQAGQNMLTLDFSVQKKPARREAENACVERRLQRQSSQKFQAHHAA